MEIVKTDRPMTLAQMEFCRQLEQSDRSGQALQDPVVAPGAPTPQCLVSFPQVGRFAVTFLEGHWSVEDGRWRHGEDGAATPVDNPLETAWQSAKAVRVELREQLELGCYIIPMAVFTDMDPDPAILEAAKGRSVRVLWGVHDLVERLANLPEERELQSHLCDRYIAQEMAVLRQRPEPAGLAPEQVPLTMGDGQLVIQHVDVVNVYVNAGTGSSISLPGAQGS